MNVVPLADSTTADVHELDRSNHHQAAQFYSNQAVYKSNSCQHDFQVTAHITAFCYIFAAALDGRLVQVVEVPSCSLSAD
jgi:hypothetical protein